MCCGCDNDYFGWNGRDDYDAASRLFAALGELK
jgi:hypothetical protein